MEFGQHINTERDNNILSTFQNHSYQFPRRTTKTIIIDSVGHDLVNNINWSINFTEPVIVDTLSDIFLDSITTYQLKDNMQDAGDCMGILLNINEFNINTNSASLPVNIVDPSTQISSSEPTNNHYFNKLYTTNEAIDTHKVVIHKGKKLNFVSTINPIKLTQLNGTITNLVNNTIFENLGTTIIYKGTVKNAASINDNHLIINTDYKLVTGMTVSGANIPGDTTITKIESNGIHITLSNLISGSIPVDQEITFTGTTDLNGRFVAEFYIVSRD